MENQEEKETSLDYFFRVTKNNAINLGRLIEMYVHANKIHDMEIEEAKKKIYDMEIEEAKKISFEEAKKMYEMEIEEAYKKGYSQGYRDHVKVTNDLNRYA